jgi:hypothetical protein
MGEQISYQAQPPKRDRFEIGTATSVHWTVCLIS